MIARAQDTSSKALGEDFLRRARYLPGLVIVLTLHERSSREYLFNLKRVGAKAQAYLAGVMQHFIC